jgi:beta-1,4-mannosyl-glycoprotein beta-1,4-N-acetylglucosaminyltransferase
MRYFDCFLYNGEKACRQIRCEELMPLNVDHISVESNYTFTGKKRNLYLSWGLEENKYRLYAVVDSQVPNNGNAWDNESHQRNYILTMLEAIDAQDDDIVIISDADEIPSLKAIQSYKPEMGLTALKMDVFWYKFNCLAEEQTWSHPKIMTYGYLKSTTPQKVRESGYGNVIDNAGHHFSYLGDADFIVNKLESFSHQEYNATEFKDKEEITRKINEGISLWGEGKFRFVPIDETFPKYLYENQEKFKSLIHQL